MSEKISENNQATEFPLTNQNYILMLIGFAIIITGFLLMVGGKASSPDEFVYDEIFSPRRITVAPIVVLLGFAFEVYAIMKKPSKA